MSRKFLITIVLILFLLPIISWYYLQSGLTWRKKAQEIMNGNQPFPTGEWLDESTRKFSSVQLEDHVTLVARLSCDDLGQNVNTLDAFYDQFKDTKKSNFILLDDCMDHKRVLADSAKMSWYIFPCKDTIGLCQSLFEKWPSGKTFALVDRNKIIRSYYPASTDDEKRILLEHMALLLPRDRSDKIELRRGEKQ